MSAEDQVSPSFNILGRLSRRNSTNTSINPDRMEPGQEVVAGPVNTTSRMFLFKPAPAFKRLKSQLEKRGRELKGKGKDLESPPLHAFENSAKPPAMEPIPQSTETSDGTVSVGPSQNDPSRGNESQNTPSRDCGEEIATENDGSGLKEPVDNEKSDPSFVDDSRSMSTASLARRIHSLLSPFPSSYTLTPSGHILCPGTSNHASAAESASADSTFFSLLSSASVMNGSISKGRESVWAALERLRYSPHPHPKEESRETGGNINATVSNELDAGVPDDVEMASVMICGPLHPTEDTEVEIARSEVVSIDLEETPHEARPSLPSDEQGLGVSGLFFGKQKGKGNGKTSEAIPLAEKALPPPPPKIKEVRVWYPSRTKVSLQAFWWGYRMSIAVCITGVYHLICCMADIFLLL